MFRRRAEIGVGSLLDNRYRLQEKLGEGGAGVIYKAEDEELGRIVAIKLLSAGGSMAGDKLERFRSEARSVARLNHPNIITLYDYAEADGQPYLVIEYVPGQDLWALDNSHSPRLMPVAEALAIVDGILAALEYSHRHQVIHRDLKPENVMITPEQQVKVMDFGLARIQGQSRLTQDGLVAGTASYLAPELALGEAGDGRVDLYAVGVILYELLAGRCPFAGDDPLAVISQHIHAPVVPPQHYNANIPDDLQAVVLKLLAKHPEERYLTAGEVRQALAPILARFREQEERLAADASFEPRLAFGSGSMEQIVLDRISRGAMVGREEEVAELKRRWDLARLGELGLEPLLLVSGEAGIGKTRLLRELQVYAGLRDGYVLHGTAQEQDIGKPYAIIANALRNYIQEQPVEVLRRQTPGFIAGEVVKLAPQLAQKIGYIAPNPPLEPEAERARLLEQVSRFLLNMVREQPTLLLLDDLHFADPASLDILETLVGQSMGIPFLIAGAYRDVALSYSSPVNHLIGALKAGSLVHQLSLRRLSQRMVKHMLEARLGNEVSREFVASIYQATEGNPLFVEEVIKGLATDGQLVLREGRWEQRDSSQLQVPGSIKSVVGSRLDKVQKTTLGLLQVAAIIGRNFRLDVLIEASPHDEEAIHRSIEEALRFQLIELSDRPAASVEGGLNVLYRFQHALIGETLYEELRPLRRRRLHRQVAAAIEKLVDEERLEPSPAILARHLIDGALDERAVPYLRQAGQAAYQVYASVEAVDYLEQATEILEDIAPDLSGDSLQDNLAQQFALLNQQRVVLNLLGERSRELEVLKRLLAVAEVLADKSRWVEAMSRLATYYWEVGRLNRAEEIAREALEVARGHNDKQGEQYCLEQIARVLWTRRNSDSMQYATQALVIAQELGDRRREGRLTQLVGHLYSDTLNDAERASIYFKQALEICRETETRMEEAWTLWGLGGLALLVNDYMGALDYYEQARQISNQMGASLQIGWDWYHMGDAWYNLGDYDQALEYYEEAQIIFNAARHLRGKIHGLISLGLVFVRKQLWDEANIYLEQAMRQAEEINDLTLMFRSYQSLADYYRRLGGEDNLVTAVRLGNRLIKLSTEGGHFEHELLGHYLRAAAFFELGNVEEALKSSQVAVEQLEQLAYIHSPQIPEAEIYYLHSRLLAALGHSQADHYLAKAHAEMKRTADLIKDEQQRQAFLEKVTINRQILVAYGA